MADRSVRPAGVCFLVRIMMKQRKRRAASSSKFVSFDNASPCRIERLEDRQLLSATIDLRTPSGGKTVNVTSVGQVVNLDVWAIVTGSDSTAVNDAFQWAHGSFLSTDVGGGAAGGGFLASGASPVYGGGGVNGTETGVGGGGGVGVGGQEKLQPKKY